MRDSLRSRWSSRLRQMWLRLTLDVKVFVQLHELEKGCVDHTSAYRLYVVDGGDKAGKENQQKHP